MSAPNEPYVRGTGTKHIFTQVPRELDDGTIVHAYGAEHPDGEPLLRNGVEYEAFLSRTLQKSFGPYER